MSSPPHSLAIALTLLMAGCYASHGADGGPDILRRDGGSAATDAPPRPDAVVVLDVPPARRDAGTPGPDGGSCTAVIAPYGGPGCARETIDCLRGCADESCGVCFELDPECADCINTSIVWCSNEAGCESSWVDFACCAARDPSCAGLSGADLVGCTLSCEGALDAYTNCINAFPDCGDRIPSLCGLE